MSNLIERRDRLREAVPHLASASGSIASFQTDMRSALEEIKIHFNPVQASGTPSPTNVLPISGWTGAVIGNTAKNFFDTAYLADASHYTAPGSYGYTYTDVMYLKPNTEYVLSASNPGAAVNPNAYMTVYVFSGTETEPNKPGSAKSLVNYSSSLGYGLVATTIYKFTTGPLGAIRVGVNKGDNSTIQDAINTIFASSNFQIELGSTATEYEPYKGNKIPVSWSALGTVYGGWVNEKGEVWATHAIKVFTGQEGYVWKAYSTQAIYTSDEVFSGALIPTSSTAIVGSCSHVLTLSNGRLSTAYLSRASQTTRTVQFLSVFDYWGLSEQSGTALDAYLQAEYAAGHPVQVCYELATPQLIGTISPITLKTLVGTNNIWANTNGNTEVKFWTH